jgi:hypothetical protein
MTMLQSQIQFFATPDSTQSIVVIIILSLLFVGFIIWASFNVHVSSKPGTYSKRDFRKQAKNLGLDKSQIHLLDFYLKATHYLSPLRALENNRALDGFLRKALAWIDSQNFSEQEKEQRKFALYKIRQTLEASSKESKILSSTLSLPLLTEVTIKPLLENRIRVTLLLISEHAGVGMPHSGGKKQRLPLGKRS